jgi:hypothetical protein
MSNNNSSSSNSNSTGNNIPIPDGEAKQIVEAFKTDLPNFCLHQFQDLATNMEFVPVDGSGNRIDPGADKKVLDKAKMFKMVDKRQQKPGDKTVYDLNTYIMMATMFSRLHRGNSKTRGDTQMYTVKDELAKLECIFTNRPWDKADRNKRGKSDLAEAQFEIFKTVGLFAIKWYLANQPGRLDDTARQECLRVTEEFKVNQAKLETKKTALAQKREKLLKSDMADVVHDMEVEIANLQAQTGSLDEMMFQALNKLGLFKAVREKKTYMDKYEGELIMCKVETKMYRKATEEDKKTYLPTNKRFPTPFEVPAGESEKWKCPQIIDNGKLVFDPSYVKAFQEREEVYNMDSWRESNGRVIPHHALVAGWDNEKKKATPPKISGAVLCPKCIVSVNPKGGKDRNVFTVKLYFARSGHIFIRAWQSLGSSQQVYEEVQAFDAETGEAVPTFKFSRPLPGCSSYDAVLWNKKDKQSDSEPWDYNKGTPMETKSVPTSSPVAMNEDSRFNDSREYGAAFKAQKEQESAEAAFAAIASQAAASSMEPDETTMMEPPAAATIALKGKGKRPLAEEQEAVNSQGAAKRAKGSGKGK